MVVHYSQPEITITSTHSAVDYDLEKCHLITDVILVENGVSQSIFTAADTDGETYLNKIDIGDNVKVQLRYVDSPGAAWTQVFGGWATDLKPQLNMAAETVAISCRGYGLALLAMNVAQEYGTESANPTLNTIHEVLTDAGDGIVPKWVLKVLDTADNSEYALNTTKVADVASSFRYLYFPYKPALNCMDDMLDLVRAANTPNAGVHWMVVPSGTTPYLCLATIGAHENPPSDVWSTWWNTNQAGSTIEVQKDMLVSRFTKQRSDANYILYHGNVVQPLDLDAWTENNAASWGGTAYAAITNDASGKVGAAIKITSQNTAAALRNIRAHYPSTRDLHLNVDNMGGKYDVPILHVWSKVDAALYGSGSNITFECLTQYSPAEIWVCTSNVQSVYGAADTWTEIVLPIGSYWNYGRDSVPSWFKSWSDLGGADWTDINAIGSFFTTNTDGLDMWLDSMYISGTVMRGARDDTKIGTQKARIKLLRDDVAKDDTLRSGTPGTTDVGTAAMLAKAELYRAVTEPVTGEIVIPGKPTIKPGQLAHIHFGKEPDGSFHVDSDMRILKVHHRFAPKPHCYRTYLTLTSDVLNSRARSVPSNYELIMRATNPDFQTREKSSLKSREIDITQNILSENYAT